MSYTPYYPSGWQSGESGGTPITPEALAHMENGIIAAASMHNILDNSYFVNPVNQRRISSLTPSKQEYTIDRWEIDANNTITVNSGSISISGGWLTQIIENNKIDREQVYTLACCDINGTIYTLSGKFTDSPRSTVLGFDISTADNPYVGIRSAGTYLWVALYAGEYTSKNLPAYIPKGYATELLECMRYYQCYAFTDAGYQTVFGGVITAGLSTLVVAVPLSIPMRIKPSIRHNAKGIVARGPLGYISEATYQSPYEDAVIAVVYIVGSPALSLSVKRSDGSDWANVVTNSPVSISFIAESEGGNLEFSADL